MNSLIGHLLNLFLSSLSWNLFYNGVKTSRFFLMRWVPPTRPIQRTLCVCYEIYLGLLVILFIPSGKCPPPPCGFLFLLFFFEANVSEILVRKGNKAMAYERRRHTMPSSWGKFPMHEKITKGRSSHWRQIRLRKLFQKPLWYQNSWYRCRTNKFGALTYTCVWLLKFLFVPTHRAVMIPAALGPA